MDKNNDVNVNLSVEDMKDPVISKYVEALGNDSSRSNNKTEKPVVKMTSKEITTAIIGIGQCGGNIANAATGKGFLTCAVNTSKEDLASCETDLKYEFRNGIGSGKERSRSKAIFKQNLDSFNEFFQNNFENVKNIIIVASAGGGTGGGSAPMCARFLKDNYKNKNIFLISIQGSVSEDIKSQENMLSVLEEINKCEVNYLVFDNGIAEDEGTEPYSAINSEVIEAAEFISRKYFVESSISNIDNVDMQKLYLENKRMMIITGTFDRRVSSKTSYIDQMINAVKDSYQIEPNGDPMAYAIYMAVEDDIYDSIDMNFRDLVDEFGEPYEVYKHFQGKTIGSPDFVICMTGLPECVEKYEQINKRVADFNARRAQTKSISDVNKVTISARNVDGIKLPEEEISHADGINKSSLDMF